MEHVSNIIRKVVKHDHIFEKFIEEIACTSTNITDLKSYTKRVGDVWEDFTMLYLQKMHDMTVYKIANCPDDVLSRLKLKRRDVGIDLIAINPKKEHIAVQCKYRKTCKALSWRDLSTFDALCMRTGPWVQCIVITTSTGVRREGLTTSKDVFWGHNHFKNLSRYDWMSIGGFGNGERVGGSNEDVHAARLRYFLNKD